MHHGSCLCGEIKYHIHGEPKKTSHCHCKMCQKQHGAAFATYVSVKKDQFEYINGENKLAVYNSSTSIKRKFCSNCGSNMEWSGSPDYPDWVSIPLATFDSVYKPKKIANIYSETKCIWLPSIP